MLKYHLQNCLTPILIHCCFQTQNVFAVIPNLQCLTCPIVRRVYLNIFYTNVIIIILPYAIIRSTENTNCASVSSSVADTLTSSVPLGVSAMIESCMKTPTTQPLLIDTICMPSSTNFGGTLSIGFTVIIADVVATIGG
jgi:hypothetical protein